MNEIKERTAAILEDLSARLPFGVIRHFDSPVPMVEQSKSWGKLTEINKVGDH